MADIGYLLGLLNYHTLNTFRIPLSSSDTLKWYSLKTQITLKKLTFFYYYLLIIKHYMKIMTSLSVSERICI